MNNLERPFDKDLRATMMAEAERLAAVVGKAFTDMKEANRDPKADDTYPYRLPRTFPLGHSGEFGEWAIERFTVTAQDEWMQRVRAGNRPGMPPRFAPCGSYVKLSHMGKALMTDTPDEIRDIFGFLRLCRRVYTGRGKQNVLVTGLGLGVHVNALLMERWVHSVTVVEDAHDVVQLVGAYWKGLHGNRLHIVVSDAFAWEPPPGQQFGCAWHDIWPTITPDNLEEMETMRQRYAPWVDGPQYCWAEGLCVRMAELDWHD